MSEHAVKKGNESPIRAVGGLNEAEGEAERVWEIITERSMTPKYLRLRTGDFQCFQRVILVDEDGQHYEITVDEIPKESN